MKHVSNTARRNTLAVALISALMAAAPAMAQDKATNLDKITVTGSLIPQTQIETQTPVMSITAEDIQTRGFSSVAEVLQQSSLTTGGLQGGQTSGAFTQGAEAAGMFGLNPGYTKYLINGRPMLSYPALYNGSESFNNISGIPIDIVERIEVLPGGQSSLYGSDAIARRGQHHPEGTHGRRHDVDPWRHLHRRWWQQHPLQRRQGLQRIRRPLPRAGQRADRKRQPDLGLPA